MTKLEILRVWLSQHNLDAMIIPTSDPHISEYTAAHWQCRQWLTNFTGSAAKVALTHAEAAMWTDSRYFIQAEQELNPAEFTLQRSGLAETPTIEEWLIERSTPGARIGLDGRLFTKTELDALRSALPERELVLTPDPFATIWSDRPALPNSPAILLAEEYTGQSTRSKLEQHKPKEGTLILSVLDDIAWLLNIRGSDIEFNPLVVAYAALHSTGRADLFVNSDDLLIRNRETLAAQGVDVHPYNQWERYLSELDGLVIANPTRLDSNSWSLLKSPQIEAVAVGAVNMAKSIKNSVEVEGFRRAMIEDGVALCRFIMWLEQQSNVTEHEASEQLYHFRSLSPLYCGASFENIMAYGANAAMAHYAPDANHSAKISTDNFLLIDSGGQYFCGTTDITRTYHFGEPTEQQRRDYTNILMGLIDISSAVFPHGTRGTQIDILARQHLWRDGANYMHGTGHGVGHYLCVHEGPQSIRMNENPITLRAGMVTSLEPAIYRAGEYGIRSENLAVVIESEHVGFEKLETLTLSPFCTKALDLEMLHPHHREWLNAYHAKVYECLSPKLEGHEQQWLGQKCQAI